jgi:hypothetical protein
LFVGIEQGSDAAFATVSAIFADRAAAAGAPQTVVLMVVDALVGISESALFGGVAAAEDATGLATCC